MLDALGDPQSVLVLGGTSEIALATIKEMPRNRLRRVLLAGRPSESLDLAVKQLQALNIAGVEAIEFDAKNTETHGGIIDAAFDGSDIDIVILAFGLLGDQMTAEADPTHAVEIATVNYTGSVSAGLHVARRLKNQGHGALVVPAMGGLVIGQEELISCTAQPRLGLTHLPRALTQHLREPGLMS